MQSSSTLHAGMAGMVVQGAGSGVILSWFRMPRKYSVTIPFTLYLGRKILGLHYGIDNNGNIIVNDFYRHPQTDAKLPAEASGQIKFLDRFERINDTNVSGLSQSAFEKVWITSSMSASDCVKLVMKSQYDTSLWYNCPYCEKSNIVDESTEAILINSFRKRMSTPSPTLPLFMTTVSKGVSVLMRCKKCACDCYATDVMIPTFQQ